MYIDVNRGSICVGDLLHTDMLYTYGGNLYK